MSVREERLSAATLEAEEESATEDEEEELTTELSLFDTSEHRANTSHQSKMIISIESKEKANHQNVSRSNKYRSNSEP